ncbi:MAG: hypothetical protein K2X47_02130 [Bdellovibrionales bacterium]|nr:hypothetical protein [Bdellovibrionales bacterium]
MNLWVLMSTCLGLSTADPILQKTALWIIAFQLTLSYFKAGFLKLRSAHWRTGDALSEFMSSPLYEANTSIEKLKASPIACRTGAWILILFECLFPLSFVDQRIAVSFLMLGICFHLATAYVFGLNRFVFAWISAYPALLYCVY